MSEPPFYDVAIVGGGPAGLSAAIWLARHLRRVVLIDSGDPRNWATRAIPGFLGRPEVTPAELRRSGRDEARHHGVVLLDDRVETAERLGDEHFRLALHGGGSVEGRRLLLAIGLKDAWPDIPGLDRIYGDTAHHCPDCDGYEARGAKTVVVASGRKAAGLALDLTTWTRELVICTNGAAPDLDAPQLAQLDALGIPVLTPRIRRAVHEGGALRALELEDGMLLDCDQLFFSIGRFPADDLGVQLGCDRDDEGLIVVDAHHHTSVHNVFAAGDIVPGPQIAIAAAAEGAIAALAIHKSLLSEERRLES
jgi:thioredoxin reductase